MYRDSAKARVAARDLRKQQVKLFKLGATITLCAFLISQLAEIIFQPRLKNIFLLQTRRSKAPCFVFCLKACKIFCFVYKFCFLSTGESPSWLRHRILIPAFEGSNPSSATISKKSIAAKESTFFVLYNFIQRSDSNNMKMDFTIPFSGFASTTFINCFASVYMYLENMGWQPKI